MWNCTFGLFIHVSKSQNEQFAKLNSDLILCHFENIDYNSFKQSQYEQIVYKDSNSNLKGKAFIL